MSLKTIGRRITGLETSTNTKNARQVKYLLNCLHAGCQPQMARPGPADRLVGWLYDLAELNESS